MANRRIDWLNHFLEFIVVVIGILLAFQLNNCREDKKEANLVNQHITNIIEESKFNQGNLEYSIEASQALLADIDTLITEMAGDQNVQKMNGLSFKILKMTPLYIKQTAYNSLKESGDIRHIDEFDLKNDIITLYEYYVWAISLNDVSMNSYSTYYYPYVLENLDMIQATPQVKEVYLDKKFKNIVSGYRYMLNMRIQQNQQTLEKVTTFLESQQISLESIK